MPIVRLVLRDAPAKPAKTKTTVLFASAGLARAYFPFRGLPHSFVVHLIGLTIAYFFTSFPVALPRRPAPQEKIVMIDLNDPMSMMFLPFVDGGTPPTSVPAKRARSERVQPAEPSAPPATTTQGFSYPGPQPVISDVEEPTNRFQTLLQPDLEAPPILLPPITIPNIALVADRIKIPEMTEPPPPEPEETPPENQAPEPAKPAPKPVETPKPEPKVPAAAPKPPEPPKPAPKPVESPKPEPKPVEPAPKAAEPPKPAPKLVEPPKPEPKPPEPAPKPVELPKPEPKPVEPPKPEPKPVEAPKPEPKPPEPAPKPEPKPVEPAPKPVELPKPAQAPAPPANPEPKLTKPEPKPAEQHTPQQAATVAKPAPAVAPVPKTAEPKTLSGQETTEPPKESSESPTISGGRIEILSLTPLPSEPGPTASIPVGEARGRFVITPEPNLNGSDAEPGFKKGTPSPKIGIGNTEGAPARKGVAPKTAPSAAAKKGPAAGSATGKSAPDAAAGGNAARAAGTSAGNALGAGNGSGTSPAKKPFAGITIVGGNYEPGSDSDLPPVTHAVRPLQTAYGLRIISTEDSGGGLPYVGVFSHEQIYTVYLDMRTVETDQDPSWTLEFALMKDSSPSSAILDLGRTQQGIVLPFPSVKEKPAWPAGLARKYDGKMVIVYGVINLEGKMEQISIKDSPDPLLNEAVVKALGKWIFRPAQSEGQAVPAKALFGIPLWAPE